MDTLTKNRIRNQEAERIENEQAAERYYRFLFTAVKQGDWKNMKKDPPEEIDWSSLPADILDQFDKLHHAIAELEKSSNGEAARDGAATGSR